MKTKAKASKKIKYKLKQLSLFDVISALQNNKNLKSNKELQQKTTSKNPYILQDNKGAFYL